MKDDVPTSLDRVFLAARRELAREAARVRTLVSGARARIVYDPRYRFPASPFADPERATRILDHLQGSGWLSARSIVAPPPLALIDLVRVHDPSYLESLDSPRTMARIFGDEAIRGHATQCLVAERWATAGTVHAAALALRGARRSRSMRRGQAPLVVNLGGGFHHAHPDRGAGFCAFNDIAAAIGSLRASGFSGRVLVVDLDLHHGDGTRAFFKADERVFTYSLHAASWDAQPAICALDVELGPAVGDSTYLTALKRTLPEFFSRAAPELVFFVAGVDVAAGDALGSYRLSADGIFARDRLVIELAGGLPMVMLLAGGYGPEAWRYTARTLLWLLSGEDRPIPTRDEAALVRFRRIRSRLFARGFASSPEDEGNDDNFGITEADLFGDLVEKRADPKLLGFYSAFGLEVAFERYGLADLLRRRGYPDFDVALDSIGTSGRGFRVFADRTRREILIEVVLSEFHGVAPFLLLSIEWLLLQDPRREPEPSDDLLPGQRYPGLGGMKIIAGMLVMTCERLDFDGLTLVPAHFHVAAKARGLLRFLDPADEARFLALSSATSGLSVGDASRRIAIGAITERATGKSFTHRPARMVLPVSPALKARVESPEYAAEVERAAKDLVLVDEDRATA